MFLLCQLSVCLLLFWGNALKIAGMIMERLERRSFLACLWLDYFSWAPVLEYLGVFFNNGCASHHSTCADTDLAFDSTRKEWGLERLTNGGEQFVPGAPMECYTATLQPWAHWEWHCRGIWTEAPEHRVRDLCTQQAVGGELRLAWNLIALIKWNIQKNRNLKTLPTPSPQLLPHPCRQYLVLSLIVRYGCEKG